MAAVFHTLGGRTGCKNRYSKPKQDLLLTLAKCFFFYRFTPKLNQIIRTLLSKQKIENTCFVQHKHGWKSSTGYIKYIRFYCHKNV